MQTMLCSATIAYWVYESEGIDKIAAGRWLGAKRAERKSPAAKTPIEKRKGYCTCSWRGYTKGNFKCDSQTGRVEVKNYVPEIIIG